MTDGASLGKLLDELRYTCTWLKKDHLKCKKRSGEIIHAHVVCAHENLLRK
jgi:hypothetical protein